MTDMPPGEHSFLSVGETASCTLNDAGTASCWGDTSCGVTEAPITPMNYVDVGACLWLVGLAQRVAIECWGDEDVTTEQFDMPTEGDFVQVAIGKYHGCALDRNGEITCWGGVGDGFDYGQNNSQKVVLYGSTAVPIILVRWISMVVLNVGDEMMLVKQMFRKARIGKYP